MHFSTITTRPPFCKMCLDLKTHQSLVPALDHPACPQLEGQWLTPEQLWNKPLIHPKHSLLWSTWECCYRIHCRPHTEFQCNAENRQLRFCWWRGNQWSLYHVQVVSIAGLDGTIFGRNPFLDSDLQLGHRLLLPRPGRGNQQQQAHKLHSLQVKRRSSLVFCQDNLI